MPFLTRAPAAGAMRRINASLEQRFQGQISEVLSIGSRVRGEAEFYNTAFVTGTRYFAVGEGVYSEAGGTHGKFNFSATTFDLRSGQPVDLAKHYHIRPFQRKGKKTAGLSLMEQAESQHQTAAFSDQKSSYWPYGIGCWGDGQDAVTQSDSEADPAVMSSVDEGMPDDPMQWTIFPTEDGLAIAYDGFAEFMRYCRANYRVIPWPQAARARRLPGQPGNQAERKTSTPADPTGASCPR